MLATRTIIGFVVGSVIFGIGVYALITGLGFQTINVEETFEIGESTSYQISANKGAQQEMIVTGEKFNLELSSPGGDPEIPSTPFTKETKLNWAHFEDGVTRIKIQNTGSSELHVVATLNVTSDPILFTYHLIVMTSGVVIIGFSMGFTLRKPKGF
ncbi:MAG: hypothetical protein OES14_04460 [Nitrosopumilus sp.]|nr:hypothetical protein [Nitrosopumilus sp.]MDH3825024.1 hypothetical protein [Nitrosopumilus sp.]